MIKKIYRYKLKSEKWLDFIELQKKADALYSKHISYEIEFSRGWSDPSRVTEIHTYKNEADLTKADRLHEMEPDLGKLFKEFKTMLAPEESEILEEVGELVKIRI